MKKKKKPLGGSTGSGNFGHAGRKGKVGGSALGDGKIDYANIPPVTMHDSKVAMRPRSEPGPLEDYEVELGRLIDAGEVETTELIDGKMVKSNWPHDWPD